MSRRNGNTPKLDLKINLWPPRDAESANRQIQSPARSATVSSPNWPNSPQSSCVSSTQSVGYSRSPKEGADTTSMLLVGCPRCLMYVMLWENDPKCPQCKSTVLLDFLHANDSAATATATATSRKTRKA